MNWLWPHRFAIAGFFVLALLTAGLEMIEPLFMRFIIDRVLLNETLDRATRLSQLHVAGTLLRRRDRRSATSRASLKDYRQKLLNVRVMLSLRRSLFDRLLHLPLPKLWDMKTGGILSRLTGDVETTSGLLQMAVISPSLSVIRLIIAIGVLMALNWRLALTALAIIPGIMVMSLGLHPADPADLPLGPQGRRGDRRPRRRDLLRHPRRPRLRPRDCASSATTCSAGTPSCARSCSRTAASC